MGLLEKKVGECVHL